MMKYNSRVFRLTAKTMFTVLALELVSPAMRSYALTSGPSQPEVQSFEPVGTTDMVDLFSGDFVYNIPLLDVEGYPINIAYHSGTNVEDEASWVGLGWNINPGVINRSVRGIPDDFSGEKIEKELNIKDEKTVGLSLGAEFELFGLQFLRGGIGNSITYNNYKGMGVGFETGLRLNMGYLSTGLGVSVGSQEGASADVDGRLSFATNASDGHSVSGSVYGGTGFNTRSGMKDISYGANISASESRQGILKQGKWAKLAGLSPKMGSQRITTGSISFNSYVPIGMKNYVSSITNASSARAISFSAGVGLEAVGGYPHFRTNLFGSRVHHESDGSRPAFGYLYLEQANEKSIMDFSREKDGVYNATLPNLPFSSMTYDLFSISGQGTGGMFRPFRNDIGTVYDPQISSDQGDFSSHVEAGIGTGLGGLFEIGANVNMTYAQMNAGPWKKRAFLGKANGSLFENFYFKQAGEMTNSNIYANPAIASKEPVRVDENMNLYNKERNAVGALPRFLGNHEDRNTRANNMSFFSNKEASVPGVAIHQKIERYPRNQFTGTPSVAKDDRLTNTDKIDGAKPNHIGEISQVLPDGRRYVYGIAAKNNVQREVTFSVENALPGAYSSGIIDNYDDADNSMANAKGRDNYYQSSVTPAFTHSYLLTDVFSADYADITGDGPTEDDLGNYTKINYSRTSADFRWRTPYERPGAKAAQFSPGYYSDKGDDKANYIVGSKEMWYIHSIESKNYIAEFYTSPRKDGMGYKGSLGVSNVSGNIGTDADQVLYRLDSIKLFSKRDRFINGTNATAIKTVVLVYEENSANQLCPGIPNYTGSNSGIGKLTLKRIYFKFGNSSRSLLNPYEFNYSNVNPAYNFLAKDRWGNYKPVVPGLSNYEFPYVDQNKTDADSLASAWQLTQVKLPSGGTIDVQYESDDYSYVQDKRAMEMFKVAGVGADKNYISKASLFEEELDPNNYIYFKRDLSREIPGRSLKENYLPEDDLLYFSFFVDVGNKNSYEPIKAYAKVEEIGVCDNNSAYGYIKVKSEKAGSSTEQLMNPITLAALNIGRYYLPHIIYPGYTDGDLDIGQTIKGMVAATEELFTIAQNPNIRFMKRGLGKAIDLNKSRIRVTTPGFTKLGGGSRVKRLEFSDGWDQMTAGGASSVLGKVYNYTMTDPTTGREISSGVANYEPLIGGDENPCRKPVYYSGDGGRLLPAVQLFQEEPLGESFYPGGAVGYSKVTVSSIHREQGTSSKGIDEYEFYTAKDFPYYVDKTAINTDDKFQTNRLVHRVDRLSISQGYTLVLNDMHGKSKAVSNYVQKGSNRELISSVKYTYQLNSQGKLENTVKTIDRGIDPYSPSFALSNRTLGQEVDITVDSRERTNTSLTVPVNFNLNVLFFAPVVVVPVPTVFSPVKMEENIFRTSTVSKVVQQYGILKSTEVIDHGAKTVTDNVVFDGESGQVVVTKTNNEYNDPISNVSYPAYWMYPGMGGAYATIGYTTTADSLYVDSTLNGFIMGPHGLDVFTEGDELLITDQQGNNYNVWVEGRDTCPNFNPGGGGNTTLITGIIPGAGIIGWKAPSPVCCATKVVPRALYPNGDNQTWLPRKSALKNVSIKIIRSGRKNQLAAMVQSLSVAGSFMPTSFADLFNSSMFSGKVLSASGSRFTNLAEEDQIDGTPWGSAYWFNNFIRGLKGSYRPLDGYAFLSSRDYANEHARKNGAITGFYSLWQDPNNFGLSGCDDISSKYKSLFNWYSGSKWKKQSQVTKYGNGGVTLEEQDAAGIYSTALFSYGGDLPVAVAQNARYRQVRYLSFDDLFSLYNGKHSILGRYTGTLKPTSYPSFSNSYYGRTFGIASISVLGTGLSLVNDGHSGQFAVQFSGGQINIGPVSDFGVTSRYYVSAWVKSSTAPNANSLTLIGTLGGAPQSYYPFTIISSPVEGWYKMEGYLTIPNKDFLTLTGTSGLIMDDFRICPDKANMKSFVYDPLTLRLFAQLDENNYATFYEYDAEGKLVRTKKETDKGILTLSESRMSAAK